MKSIQDQQPRDPWIIVLVFVVVLMIIGAITARAQQTAQLDTVLCKTECIQQIVSNTTKSGNTTYRAVYVDRQAGISEIIPISKTVVQYIKDCKTYGMTPTLAIKLKNGEISSIIRIKTKYKKLKR